MLIVACVIIIQLLVARLFLSGSDHSQYDSPEHLPATAREEPSLEHGQVAKLIGAWKDTGGASGSRPRGRGRLRQVRNRMDQMAENLDFEGKIFPVDVNGVDSEWVIAPGSKPNKRILYVHGGGFVAGSSKSHRPITSELARRLGASVLAINYRLMPENTRKDSIEDCRTAYKWILKNGPDGESPAKVMVMAGDSAGGNLVLSTAAWARDQEIQKADIVIALSPVTDVSWSSPSIKSNRASDIMLGSSLGQIGRIPRSISLWFAWIFNRTTPNNPEVSPLFGRLSGLPPTLIHASSSEMLFDDCKRYVNKANDSGSEAVLGVWPLMIHVWHIFVGSVPEAKEAFDNIEEFVNSHIAD